MINYYLDLTARDHTHAPGIFRPERYHQFLPRNTEGISNGKNSLNFSQGNRIQLSSPISLVQAHRHSKLFTYGGIALISIEIGLAVSIPGVVSIMSEFKGMYVPPRSRAKQVARRSSGTSGLAFDNC
ncbi:MAG: hypothetical protein JO166_20530 [Deltaproteobacteria bacterium]|nr:hypothetical protein [Deltaproteobacteria bacterium]